MQRIIIKPQLNHNNYMKKNAIAEQKINIDYNYEKLKYTRNVYKTQQTIIVYITINNVIRR